MFSRIASALSVSKPRANSGDGTPSPASTISGRSSPGFSPDPLSYYRDIDVSDPEIESTLFKVLHAGQVPDRYLDKVAPYLRFLLKSGDKSRFPSIITKSSNPCVVESIPPLIQVIELQLTSLEKQRSQSKPDEFEDLKRQTLGGIEQAYKSIAELLYDYESAWKENFVRQADGSLKMKSSHVRRVSTACSGQYQVAGRRKKTKKRQQKKRKTLRRTRH